MSAPIPFHTSPSVLVVQPLPGIGDMVWHLAHIRAIARHFGGPVTLLAKPRSLADQLFAGEDTVRRFIWLDRNPRGRVGRHDGPAGLLRLLRALRGQQFTHAVILHHSWTLAAMCAAAGIPVRQGYGFGAQRRLLTAPPFLAPEARARHQLQRATEFVRAAGFALEDDEPRLPIAPAAAVAVQERLAGLPRPFVAIGIGSSERHRQWGPVRQSVLGQALLDAGWGGLALIGGPEDRALATEVRSALRPAAPVTDALGWHLAEAAALIAEAGIYVGNDTGMMNLAAAVGTRAYALFGASPPLFHSRQIVPILPPGGRPVPDGMAQITEAAVLAAISADRGRLAP